MSCFGRCGRRESLVTLTRENNGDSGGPSPFRCVYNGMVMFKQLEIMGQLVWHQEGLCHRNVVIVLCLFLDAFFSQNSNRALFILIT